MRPLRGAIVGFGFIAERGHLRAYRERDDGRLFDVVAVADPCEARLERARALLPHARLYRSHEAMLDGERGRIDFVDVATPPCDHARIAHAAIAHGLHVLVEKPLATRRIDARALLAHARAAGRVIFPCHNYRHAPVIAYVDRLLDAGAIGGVHMVTLDTFRTTHARGAPEWRPDWRRDRRVAGGGIAMDHGAHTFYLALRWMKSAPVSVSASATSLSPALDTEDTFVCTVSFPTGVALARLTWNAGVRKVIYTLHGDCGAVRIEDDDVEVTTRGREGKPVVSHERVGSAWMDPTHVAWFRETQARFAAAIDAGEHVGPDALDALACVDLITCGYASARDGAREVALPRLAPRADAAPVVSAREHVS